MLFGNSFKKIMKEHVEAMRCIRKISNSKTESFFRKGGPQNQYLHFRGGANNHRGRGTTRTGATISARMPEKKTSGRRTSHTNKTPQDSQGRDSSRTDTRDCVCISKFTNIVNPPELQTFYPSITVNQLKARGIVTIAQALATERSIPLAGRLSHCLSNWQ